MARWGVPPHLAVPFGNWGICVLRQWFVAALTVSAMSLPGRAACVDPSTLVRSTVEHHEVLRRRRAETRRARHTWYRLVPFTNFDGHRGACRYGHGAFQTQDWKQVEVLEGENKQSIDVRIQRLAGSHAEKIAVLELRAAYSGAQSLQIRMEPLAPEEQVVSLAYPGNRLRFAAGRFVQYGDSDRSQARRCSRCTTETTGLCSITVPQAHRSGLRGPCGRGRQQHLHANVQFPSRAIRISTAWGSPTSFPCRFRC